MTTLSIMVEGSACSWGRLAQDYGNEGMQEIIRSIISFANSHLSMSSSNNVLLFMYANGLRKKLVFNSQRQGSSSDHSLIMARAIRSALRESADSDDLDCSSPLASVLSHAICHMKQNEESQQAASTSEEKTTTTTTMTGPVFTGGRIVVVSMTADFGPENGSLMNLFFSAAKQGVCVDVACLGEASPLLQQAADITNGQFVQVESPRTLLKHLMVNLLPPPSIRSLFPQASLKSVDYRASCACHQQLVSTGWVCSVCLSVLCQIKPFCSVCRAVFKLSNLPVKKGNKRKAK